MYAIIIIMIINILSGEHQHRDEQTSIDFNSACCFVNMLNMSLN